VFGFRTRIALVDRDPCELGVTCDAGGNKLSGGGQRVFVFESRQTGEEFESDGLPECRTELNPGGCI
jgi:hypothetical protein